MMRRRDLLATLPVLAAFPRRARAADQLSLLLDWFINPNHAPIVVAGQIGAFERRGLAVNLVQPADPTMPPRLVAAGHGDIAVSYQAVLYRQVANGLPLLRIGALQDRMLVSLAAIKSRGVSRIADLKGRRVGYNEVGGDATLAWIDTILHTAGLALTDVALVNVGTALTTSLLTGRVDAVTIVRNFEAFEIEDKGQTPVIFNYEDYGVPQVDGFIYVIARDRAQDPRFPRFLDAVREGTAYLRAHPDEAWKLFVKAYPDLDNALNRRAWNYTLPYFAADPASFDRHKYEVFGQYLVDHHILAKAPAVADYAITLASPPAQAKQG